VLQQSVPAVQKVEALELDDSGQRKGGVGGVEESGHKGHMQIGHNTERGGAVRGVDACAADGVARHVAHSAAELRGGGVARHPHVQRLRPNDVVPPRQHHAQQRAAGWQHGAHAHPIPQVNVGRLVAVECAFDSTLSICSHFDQV